MLQDNNAIKIKVKNILYIENAKRGSKIIVSPKSKEANFENIILLEQDFIRKRGMKMLRNIHKKNFIFAGVVLLITSMIIIFITLKGKSTQDLETIDLNKFEQLITTATSECQYIYL